MKSYTVPELQFCCCILGALHRMPISDLKGNVFTKKMQYSHLSRTPTCIQMHMHTENTHTDAETWHGISRTCKRFIHSGITVWSR